jgi:putative transposase
MADELSMALLELLRKADPEGRADFVRTAVERLMQAIIDLEVEQRIGAGRYERTEARSNYRNGSRPRDWDTTAGTVHLRIPKLRHGSFFPALLEPRRRADRALVNVVAEAYVQGVSTRKVDELVQALGLEGIDKSTVSRLATTLDEEVRAFRQRALTQAYPYLWLDATFPKVREGGRVVSMALMIAVGVDVQGQRSILGLDLGYSENGANWTEFLRSLVDRGLHGVQLVTSDDHKGLKAAVRSVLVGATWQRCTVHFTRNAVAQAPKQAQPAISAMVRQIFAQPDRQAAEEHLARTAQSLQPRFPKVATMLLDAEPDLLAHMDFPAAHWRQIRSTNGLERLNREITRRTDVVGIFPNREAVIRLAGALLAEQDDEWAVGRRYFSVESMQALVRPGASRAAPDVLSTGAPPLPDPQNQGEVTALTNVA